MLDVSRVRQQEECASPLRRCRHEGENGGQKTAGCLVSWRAGFRTSRGLRVNVYVLSSPLAEKF